MYASQHYNEQYKNISAVKQLIAINRIQNSLLKYTPYTQHYLYIIFLKYIHACVGIYI